ncbi:MAG: alkaline phosphatase PafA [Bacteroidota bacterium]
MKAFFPLLALLFVLNSCVPKKDYYQFEDPKRPKLVVGIVVDQMRADYIYRFYDKFSDNGFKRLLRDGFEVKNTKYDFIPTYTGPGHATVYTGATPSLHGIIANNWYSYKEGKEIYCAYDSSRNTIGSDSKRGKYSPKNILSSTITDELHLFTNLKSKVYGVSIKDRGAIFPAGRSADGAFWYDPDEGKFISSDFYYQELPGWVEEFNSKNLPDQYLGKVWNTLLPIEEYFESTADDVPYEGVFKGKEKPIFPYNLSELRSENSNFGLLSSTPYGNTIVTDMVLHTIDSEEMGVDETTDFMAMSYSSTDYIGHRFGPNSIEVEDTYLRLDLEIERLLNHLDEKVGNKNYLIFLTADHGVERVPEYLADQKLSAGSVPVKDLVIKLADFLVEKYGTSDVVENVGNNNIYLNRKMIKEKGMDIHVIREEIRTEILNHDLIVAAYTFNDFVGSNSNEDQKGLLLNGFHPNRSGDILFNFKPGYLPRSGSYRTGTSHGSGYTYDTHVPLLWYGWKIEPGYTVKPYSITDIAATLSMKLNIPLPNSCVGQPIEELF